MDQQAVLAAFNDQIRRNLAPQTPGESVEQDGPVMRVVATGDGWDGVIWTGLDDDATATDAVIEAQISRFAAVGRPWEWKHFSYDRPADLPQRLVAAGFTPEPSETLLVAEIADLEIDLAPPPGVSLVDVVDRPGVDALVRVHDEVFGGDHSGLGRNVLADFGREPRTIEAVVAMAGSTPISAGRVEFTPGTDFASLWGGGTRPEWRRRGVFRALVAHRARSAAARGLRYLQVDATADSRPILRRLGFVELATTTPFKHPGTIPND